MPQSKTNFVAQFKLTPVFTNVKQGSIFLDSDLKTQDGTDSFDIRNGFKDKCEFFTLENLENGEIQKYTRHFADGRQYYTIEKNQEFIF